jgi:oxygen-independent coproporphyrinogen-3 oxidase
MADFLYIHIPFCLRKCRYCDFLSVPYDASSAGHYLDALCRELELKKDNAGTLRSIYIGGGTPTILSEKHLRNLLECIRNNYFLSSDAEITVEANPGSLDRTKIDTMLSLGVNRLSVGVQSFHDNELKTLGRIHSADDAQRSLALVRKSGIENFSIDLMYGIPGQDVTSWLESLAKAAEFSPMHISAYELTPEQNTPFFHLLNSNRIEMPDDDQILTMYASGIDYLESRGYAQYEISNFAFRDYECRHNLNYWDRGEYLGAGAGAHSFLNNIRSRNTGDIGKYIEELASGNIPVREPLRLTPEDSLRESLFLGLRKKQGVRLNKSAIFSENGIALCRVLIDEGFLEIYGDSMRLTRKGFPVSNAVIVELFGKFGL